MDSKDAALKYLASRARTCREVERHLLSKGFAPEEICETIERLKELRYVDDEDYCARYLEYAAGKGRGPLRIRRELEEKGVERETIQIAFEEYETEESDFERAKEQAEKIARGKPVDKKLLARIGRRLHSMGYPSDVIYQVIGIYMGKASDEEEF